MDRSLFILVACLVSVTFGQVSIEPEVIEGREGENVTITCIVGPSEPSSTQLLTDNNQLLTYNTQDIQSDRVVYTYGPLMTERDDGREVICSFGVNTAIGTISVIFPPLYTVDSAQRDVVEGEDNYTVMINVTGNPLPTAEETTWTFSRVTGPQVPSGVNLLVDSLSFEMVTRQHSGVYSVSSTTSAGTSNTLNITINVLYPPMFVGTLSESIACGMDGSTPYLCAMRSSDSGTLNCGVVGNPLPSLSITESSSVISGDTASGQITVGPVTAQDNGATVQCSATNSQDTVERSFVIYVGSEPAQPSSVNATVQDNMVVITWIWNDPSNNVPLSRFLLTVTRDGESTPNISKIIAKNERSYSIDLSQLEADTLYNIAVQANNLLDSSDPVGDQVTTPVVIDGGSGGAGTLGSCVLSVLLMLVFTLFL